ncbi:TPA: GNAT family N-acetyltransferase [Streptococcus suis]
MIFTAITDSQSPAYQAAYGLIKEAFPIQERRTDADQVATLANPHYQLLQVQLDEEASPIGVVGLWDCQFFYFIEHLVTAPQSRNGGMGGRILQALKDYLEKPIVLEVELGTDDLKRRRIGFYQRHQFKYQNYDYQQPSYHRGAALDMALMTYPDDLSPDQFEAVKAMLYQRVYL